MSELVDIHLEEPFGLYVHWPFCRAKCPYCDFNSHVRHQPVDETRLCDALVTEMETTAARTPGRTLQTIFFGGGTPSLMSAATVDRLIGAAKRLWAAAPDLEVTLEANPTSVEATNFEGYAAAGVNRLSIGVQALNDADLKALGRQHSVEEAIGAIRLAEKCFARMSFDLIYARQGQTQDAWAQELKRAIDLSAGHLSLYQLTIEDGTPFRTLFDAGKLRIPGEDLAADLYETTNRVCEENGLPAYEISNHARPGQECRHNLIYWTYGEYAGIGAGAHGRLIAADGQRMATRAEAHPETWAGLVEEHGHGFVEDIPVKPEQAGDEALLMGLRLRSGLDLSRYEMLYRAISRQRIADLVSYGLLGYDGKKLKATAEGALVLNSVIAELALPE